MTEERRFSFFRTENFRKDVGQYTVSVESFQSKKKNRELLPCNFIEEFDRKQVCQKNRGSTEISWYLTSIFPGLRWILQEGEDLHVLVEFFRRICSPSVRVEHQIRVGLYVIVVHSSHSHPHKMATDANSYYSQRSLHVLTLF